MIAALRKAVTDARFIEQMIVDVFRSPSKASCPAHVEAKDTDAEIVWLGHASFFLRMGERRILLDPVFSDRVGPRLGPLTFGPKRYTRAPHRPDSFTAIDSIVLSHAHFDHLDVRSLERVIRLHRPKRLITSPGTDDLIPLGRGDHEVISLRPGESVQVRGDLVGLTIEAFEAEHRGARWRYDTRRKTNGYILSGGGRRVLFIGDTAITPRLERLARRLGPVDIALLPIGAYDPYARHHITPEQAVELAESFGAGMLFPHHHSTFRLSDEPLSEPMKRFLGANAASSLVRLAPRLGEPVPLPSKRERCRTDISGRGAPRNQGEPPRSTDASRSS